ncbi:hypothetical protein BJ998_002226 [Kutzneria kofuensis]|uniref:ATP-grasp domain-containing protein n=1 Tax=Kutzneria kofuensis TaxID=103725 RepID=A0A7W9KEA4_9PSEU|nr:hypothetical protein [Kutzneria kofuensis]
MDTDERPHLLVIAGIGGPSPMLLAPSLAPVARLTWLYDERDLSKPDRDVSIMAESGRALAVTSDSTLLTAASATHVRDPFDGMLTFSESSLRVGAAVGEELGLPFNSTATVERLTNKYLQRVALTEDGVPCPRFHPVRQESDLDVAARKVGFPAVLKPIRGGGSALTAQVDSMDELREAWQVAAKVLGGLDAGEGLVAPILCGDRRRSPPAVCAASCLAGSYRRPSTPCDRISGKNGPNRGRDLAASRVSRYPNLLAPRQNRSRMNGCPYDECRTRPHRHEGELSSHWPELKHEDGSYTAASTGLSLGAGRRKEKEPPTRRPGGTPAGRRLGFLPEAGVGQVEPASAAASADPAATAAGRRGRRRWATCPGRGTAGCRGRWSWSGPGCCGPGHRG